MCREFIVSGKVQGVFFRANTRDVATRHGLTGHAVNLADGAVEVQVCGDDAGIRRLREWLQAGSPPARVEQIVERSVKCVNPLQFAIR